MIDWQFGRLSDRPRKGLGETSRSQGRDDPRRVRRPAHHGSGDGDIDHSGNSGTQTNSVSLRAYTLEPAKAGCAQVKPMMLVRDCS